MHSPCNEWKPHLAPEPQKAKMIMLEENQLPAKLWQHTKKDDGDGGGSFITYTDSDI